MNGSSGDPIDHLARAFGLVAAYLQEPSREPEDAFLARHSELHHLLEPMLNKARSLGTMTLSRPPAIEDPDRSSGQIGPYQIVKEIGRGGQAIVYLAEDRRLHRKVALKMLTGMGLQSPATRMRLQREAEAASKLDHPGICSVYEVGEERDIPYIAMRYVEGKTLSEILAATRVAIADGVGDGFFVELREGDEVRESDRSETDSRSSGPSTREAIHETVSLIERLARALHLAHEAGLVHRDIKPRNIMVTPTGDPVLLDFGLAHDLSSEALTLTQTGQLVGTPAYLSPEQLAAKRVPVDRRADVYALGVTLYECLTLRLPFEMPTRAQLYQKILVADPPNPRRLNPKIPKDLAAVVEVAMQKDPVRRYQTAVDFADDLRRIREYEPIRAKPPGTLVRVHRWARRRPALAALLLVLIIGLPSVSSLGGYLLANLDEIQNAKQQAHVDDVEAQLQAAFDELLHRDEGRAVSLFDMALALEPCSAEAVCGKALALRWQKQLEECIELLRAHAALATQAPGLLRIRCEAHRQLGQESEARALESRITPPVTPTGFFVEGMRFMGGCEQRNPKRLRRALESFNRAVLTSPQPRALFHTHVAHVAGHLSDEVTARRVVLALNTLWPDSPDAWFWAGFALSPVDSDGAIKVYRESIRLEPNNPVAHSNLGKRLRKTGDLQGAIAAQREAIRLDPKFGDAYLSLGVTLGRSGDIQGAIEAHRGAIRCSPDRADAHNQLGMALERSAELRSAIVAYREAIRRDPDHAKAYYNLGRALRRSGDLKNAIAAYHEAIRSKPDYSKAHYNLGNALRLSGDLKGAIGAYRNAIRYKPDFADAYNNIGGILGISGDHAGALRAFRSASRICPGHKSAKRNEGNALFEMGDFPQAISAYRAAIRVNQKDVEAHQALAESLLSNREPKAAIEAIRRAMQIAPDDVENHCLLGRSLSDSGDTDGAMKAYQQAIRKKPDCFDAHFHLGQELQKIGDPEQAADAYRTVIRLHAGHAKAYFSLGHILFEQGRHAEALPHLRIGHQLGSKQKKWKYRSEAKLLDCAGSVLAEVSKHVARLSDLNQDAGSPDEAARTRLRNGAAKEFAEVIEAWRIAMDTGHKSRVRQMLRSLKLDESLKALRTADHLSRLPATERKRWGDLWHAVEGLEKQLAE